MRRRSLKVSLRELLAEFLGIVKRENTTAAFITYPGALRPENWPNRQALQTGTGRRRVRRIRKTKLTSWMDVFRKENLALGEDLLKDFPAVSKHDSLVPHLQRDALSLLLPPVWLSSPADLSSYSLSLSLSSARADQSAVIMSSLKKVQESCWCF